MNMQTLKLRVVILFTLFFLFTTHTYSQFAQGNKTIGGTINLSIDLGDSASFFGLWNSYGVFMSDQFLLEGSLGFTKYFGGENLLNDWDLSVGPTLSYYFLGDRSWQPFVRGSLLYNHSKQKSLDPSPLFPFGLEASSRSGYVTQVGPGVAFALNQHILLDLQLAYTRSESEGFANDRILLFTGFKMILDRKTSE